MKNTPLKQYQIDLQQALAQASTGDWFERYINHSRGLGNTFALINACRQAKAVLVTANMDMAESVKKAHRIQTVSINNASFAAHPSRSVVDNFAILSLVREERKIIALAEQLLQILAQKGVY